MSHAGTARDESGGVYDMVRGEGQAAVWHESVTTKMLLNSTLRTYPRSSPVRHSADYSTVASSVFEVSRPADSLSSLPTSEHEGTLTRSRWRHS